MSVAFIQEWKNAAPGTDNYDAVSAQLDAQSSPPEGLIVHTAGRDSDGVFRIFDIWESREQAERFHEERVAPIVKEMMSQRGRICPRPTWWTPTSYTISSTPSHFCSKRGCRTDEGVMLYTLQFEHAIRDFAMWKAVFDRDPIDRHGLGVRHHRVRQPTDDPNYVIGELEFATIEEAQACAAALRELWQSRQAAPALSGRPKVRIVETVEEQAYSPTRE